MKAPLKNAMKIGFALLALAALCACDDDSSDGSGSTIPAASGSTSGNSIGGSSGGGSSSGSSSGGSTGGSTSGSGSASNSTGTASDSPPALPSAPSTAQLVGTWEAPKESLGFGEVQYSFTLEADHSAVFATATYGQLSVGGAPTDGAIIDHAAGTWDLAGLYLVLGSPVPEMLGAEEIQPLDRRWIAMQVTLNGRTYRKQ